MKLKTSSSTAKRVSKTAKRKPRIANRRAKIVAAKRGYVLPRAERPAIDRQGQSYGELAKLTALSHNYLVRTINKEFVPSLERARILAPELGLTMHELAMEFGLVGPPPKTPWRPVYLVCINQKKLGSKVGVDHAYLSRVFARKQRPSFRLVALLAVQWKCTVDYVIEVLGL